MLKSFITFPYLERNIESKLGTFYAKFTKILSKNFWTKFFLVIAMDIFYTPMSSKFDFYASNWIKRKFFEGCL